MRRLLGWTAGVVGIAALARALARRSRPKPVRAPSAPPVDERAEALRRKLDETRAVQEAHAPPPAEGSATTTPEAEGPDAAPRESIEERRARVHAKAQEAIQAMQETPG